MRKSKINPAFVVAGAILAIGLAVLLIFKQATTPSETINTHPEKIPQKGAGARSSDK